MHFFTSVTVNYIPKARTLANSVKKYCPDSTFYLVLSDKIPEGLVIENESFDKILYINDLDLPIDNLEQWIFKHTVVELCTAVKGQAFLKIFESTRADKVVYLDPDIAVFNDLSELSELLTRYSIILTPHLIDPEDRPEAIMDNEISCLKHGTYNLGFLAVKRSEEGLRFITWWRDRLVHYCYDDIGNGLFTDQKWIDLAPAFFDNLHILRDKTYNVATWNISQRQVEMCNETLSISGIPVKFYHFSGFDSGAQEAMLNKYGGKNKVLKDLRDWYIDAQERAGQKELGDFPCVYGAFSNGEPISKNQRRVYRSRLDVLDAFPNPFQVTDDKMCYYWWYKNEYANNSNSEDALKDEVEKLTTKLNMLLSSRSWIITRPLRRFMRLLRKR